MIDQKLKELIALAPPIPCPFCGAGNTGVVEGDTFKWLQVQCYNCAACGPEVRAQTCGGGDPADWKAKGDQAAIKEWNTRVTLAQPALEPPTDEELQVLWDAQDFKPPGVVARFAHAVLARWGGQSNG